MTTTVPTLTNPYAGKPRDELTCIAFWVSPEDHHFITAVYPFQGRWQNLFGTLFKEIVNELKRKGITSWTTESERAIVNVVNALLERVGRADTQPDTSDGQSLDGHDDLRTPGVRGEGSVAPGVPTDPISSTTRRGRTNKKTNRGRKTKG